MLEFLRDLRYGLRSWINSPGVALVTLLSLGFGIAVTTSIFTVANSLLFRSSTGFSEPERLVKIYTGTSDGQLYGGTSYPDFEDLGSTLTATESIAAGSWEPMTLGTQSPQRIVLAEKVTWNYFSVVGVEPPLGRAFSTQDASFGNDRVAVVSHDFWMRELQGDIGAIGRTIDLGARLHTILGVAPADLDNGNPLRRTSVWLPLSPGLRPSGRLARDLRRLSITARLSEGSTIESLQAQLGVVASNLHRDHPDEFSDDRAEALAFTALKEQESALTPDRRAVIAILALFPLIIAALILLIACSNVATLFLARAEQRGQETAVRLALGASRRRLVSLLFAESLIPGLASGALGIGLAWAASRALQSVSLPGAIPISLDFGIDTRVIGFAVLLAVGTTLVFGMVPALAASKPDLVTALKSHTGSGRSPGQAGWRRVLVGAQIAASLVLIVGSGLFYRGVRGAATLDLGFEPAGIALTTKRLPPEEYSTEAARLWVRNTLARLRSLPGVQNAQASSAVELTLASAEDVPISIADFESSAGKQPRAYRNAVTPGYLEMLEFSLLRGRLLRETDRPGSEPVAVVNDVFAQRFWPDEQALGRTFQTDRESAVTVVGVLRDGKFRDIDDPPLPHFWTPLSQGEVHTVALLAKGQADPSAMVALLQREIERADGEVTLIPPTTLDSMIDIQFAFGRLAVRALAWGGAFGLVLAAIGIYGIVSFSVACRTRELAIRMAVGASRRQVVQIVAREGLLATLAGLAVGLLVVLPLARLVEAQLLGTSPADPGTLAAGASLLLVVAIAASVVPARRATLVDPVKALRQE